MAKSQAQLIAEGNYEYCCVCGNPTGKAGKGDDSLYCDDCGDGPFCEACYEAHRREEIAQWHQWEAEEAEDEAWHMGEAAAYASGRIGEDDHACDVDSR